ncbi:hypothetical protein AB0333_16705 [Citricoccus sp. NPDC079358]
MSTVARQALQEQFGLNEEQARAAVNMQFISMTKLRGQQIRDEVDALHS